MKIHLLDPSTLIRSTDKVAYSIYAELESSSKQYVNSDYELTDSLDAADLVILGVPKGLCGPFFEVVRSSDKVRAVYEKLIVYCPSDDQFPAIRGIYPSISKKWVDSGWALSSHFVSAHRYKYNFDRIEASEKDVLCCFVGSTKTDPIREKLFEFPKREDFVMIDCAPKDGPHWWMKKNLEEDKETFRNIMRRTKFVLCPRGVNSASPRIFEAMECGAVPVLIADALQPVPGPDWGAFSITVKERDVLKIPGIIDSHKHRAEEMGRKAREEWERYFSVEKSFNTIAQLAVKLGKNTHRRKPLFSLLEQYYNPKYLRQKIRFLNRNKEVTKGDNQTASA